MDLIITARRKMVTVTGHLPREMYSFIGKLPGYKKYKADGCVFAATRPHIDLFRETFPNVEISDQDGCIEALYKPLPPIVEHERRTTSKLPLFEHQRRALDIALSRSFFAYFHDMGTGKTATLLHIAAELYARGAIDRAIIVTSKRVVQQIVTEQAPLHFPNGVKYKIHAFPSTQATRAFKYPDHHLLIAVCGYGALQSDKQTAELIAFAKDKGTAIFLDESQNIKSWSSKRVKNLWTLRPYLSHRYLFSGEPAPLGPIDLFSQFQFLSENIIGHSSLTSFRNEFCLMGGFEQREIVAYRNLDSLSKAIAPHSEYLKISELRDMPEKVYVTHKLEANLEARKLYGRMKEDFVIAVTQASKESDAVIASKLAKNAAAKFMSLAQISNGFFLTDPEEGEKKGDVVVLNTDRADFVAQELVSHHDKTVIFARFHADLDAIQIALKKENISCVELSGRRSNEENERARIDFTTNDAVKVICATAASGGTGLNLQCAHRTIFYSNTYSYGDRVQAEARTWRTGQNQRCVYYDIEVFPIDKLIRQNLFEKQDLSQQLSSLSTLKSFADRL